MNHTGRLLSLLLTVLLCGALAVRAARDDERINQLKAEIGTLEAMAAENPGDRDRLQHRIGVMREELAILEKRQAIEAQERGLQSVTRATPLGVLREKLRTIPADAAPLEKTLGELGLRRTQIAAERDALLRQSGELKDNAAAAARRAELDERVFTQNEQLRALALQQETVETEIDLVHQAQGLRERLRGAEVPGRASLRMLFAHRRQMLGDTSRAEQFKARMANLGENLRNSEAALDLARQKLAKFAEELQLLERQTNFFRRNAQAEQFLAAERAQKQLLGDRLPFLGDQVEALRKTRETAQAGADLAVQEKLYLEEQYHDLLDDYLAQLWWPGGIAALLILAHVVVSRIILPKRYQKEALFLARRLGRYAVGLLILLVFAFYLIEDLTLVATTLGLVSAAVVFSIQDVCAAFFGWFAIMFGRKFTVGDRLEIEGVRGDVLDIQLLRTTLIEVNNWLGVDQPTGRVLFIPNNFIFKSKVFNFSHGHPYIWGKIEVTVTFATPTASAMALFQKVLEEETRQDFAEARAAAGEMERRYGVEDADYRPKIYTRIADSGVLFSLIYVSHYKNSSGTRNRINRRLIAELETHRHIQLAYNTLQVLANTTAADTPSAVLGMDATQAPFMVRMSQPPGPAPSRSQ
ncbi:MAG: mechanosensitive ion channel [Opitutae bacterium]|nr:mechanosensitive ion channel [Opitutae bacterium]